MKNLLFLVLTVFLVSCGNDSYVAVDREVPVPYTPEHIAQSFEGVHYLSNNSFIELTVSEDNDITIESSGQVLVTVNPENDTLGTFPVFSGKYEVHNDEIRFTRNMNYTSGHDIEEDVSGSNITGQRQTTVIIGKNGDDGIKVTILIYDAAMNNNINSIVAKRIFKSN